MEDRARIPGSLPPNAPAKYRRSVGSGLFSTAVSSAKHRLAPWREARCCESRSVLRREGMAKALYGPENVQYPIAERGFVSAPRRPVQADTARDGFFQVFSIPGCAMRLVIIKTCHYL